MDRTFLLQKDGQITLPEEWRDKYGLKEGDLIAVYELENGSLVLLPREQAGIAVMNMIHEALVAEGITLEQLLEDSEKIRQEIYEEKYANKVNGNA